MTDYETEDRLDSLSRKLKTQNTNTAEANENIWYIWEEIAQIKKRLDKLEGIQHD